MDDGIHNRCHRENIFKEEFKVMACHTGKHKTLKKLTCIDYADAFEGHARDALIVANTLQVEEESATVSSASVRTWNPNSKMQVRDSNQSGSTNGEHDKHYSIQMFVQKLRKHDKEQEYMDNVDMKIDASR